MVWSLENSRRFPVFFAENPDCASETKKDVEPVGWVKWSIFNPDARRAFLHRDDEERGEGQPKEQQRRRSE